MGISRISKDGPIQKAPRIRTARRPSNTEPSPAQATASEQTAGLSIPFHILAMVVVAVLSFLIYSNTFNASFHFDDEQIILANPYIRDLGLFFPRISYRPRILAEISFALNYHFFKYDVFGFHLFNLLIHIGCGIMAFFLTRLTFESPRLRAHSIYSQKDWVSIFAGLIFIAHPVQTQAVTYIVQRSAAMATFFYLGALVFYAKARLENKVLFYVPSVVMSVGSVLSKDTAYTLPIAALLYELIFWGWDRKRSWMQIPVYILFFVPAAAMFLLFYNVGGGLQKHIVSLTHDTGITRNDYLLTQFNVIRTYLRLCFLPIKQNLDYDYPISRSLFEPHTLASLFLHLTLVGVALKASKKNPLISYGILWFYLTLSIESSIVPIVDVIFEHRVYLPLYGFVLVLTGGLYAFFKNRRDFIIVAILIVAAFSFATYKRNAVWKNDLTLWTDIVKKAPSKPRGYVNLGNIYANGKRMRQAKEIYEKGLAVDPKHAETYNALGAMYHEMEDYPKALEYYQKALELQPDYVDFYYNVGLTYSFMKNHDKAIEYFQEAIRRNPGGIDFYKEIGGSYGRKREYDKAIEYLLKGLEYSPKSPKLLETISIAYIKKGDVENARKYLERFKQTGDDIERADFLLKNIDDRDEEVAGEVPDVVQEVYYFENGQMVRRQVTG